MSSPVCKAKRKEKPAWILHMGKEPFHRCFRVAIARREQSLLGSNQREAHRFELGQRGLVEFWQSRFRYGTILLRQRQRPSPSTEQTNKQATLPGAFSGSLVSPG
jgi:hypothetical protein